VKVLPALPLEVPCGPPEQMPRLPAVSELPAVSVVVPAPPSV
jgi:hypothetical protein